MATINFQNRVTIDPAEIVGSELYGISVDVSGDYAVVGCPYKYTDPPGVYYGSAYVYKKNAVSGNWEEQQELFASDKADFDEFGASVAIDGDTIIVGAYAKSNGGKAYIFTRSGATWSEQQAITSSTIAAGDSFGIAVDISGESVIVGASGDDDSGSLAGTAWVFTRAAGVWSEQQKLEASDAAASDQFGTRVAIDSDSCIISAPEESAGVGAVYIFTRSGAVWSQQQKIVRVAPDPVGNEEYGYAVDIQGDVAVVGAYLENNLFVAAGSAYVYKRSGGVWTKDQRIPMPAVYDDEAGSRFGFSVALDSPYLVVGASRDDDPADASLFGSAFVFETDGSTYTLVDRIHPGVTGETGSSVGIDASDAVILVGAQTEHVAPEEWNDGAARFYNIQTVASGLSLLCNQFEVDILVGSGVLTYTTPIAPARTEAGQDAYPAAIGSYSNYTDQVHPNTENMIEGWKWDERVWSDEYVENQAITIPSLWDPTTSGVTQSYFQSGIGNNRDLELLSLQQIPSSGVNDQGIFRPWAPEINHGYYYDYEDEDYLYSDDSEIETVTYSGIVPGITSVTASGHNLLTLSTRPKVGVPIKIEQYQWDNSNGKYTVSTSLRRRSEFTGIQDVDYSRADTYDENKEAITWANIDQTVDEFVVTFSGTYPEVVLNRQYVEQVGTPTTLPSGLEFLGYSDGTAGQQFHTEYAPVDSSMGLGIYSYTTASGTLTQWEAIDFNIVPSGNQVRFDYDEGVLEFGDTAVSGQNIPAAGDSIALTYWKTLRLEYEPEYTNDSILAGEANTNQIYRRSPRGFILLATSLEDPASITLEAELPIIQTDQYGPLTIGNTFAPVVATVKDSNGNLLEGQTVSFQITSDPVAGSFGVSDSTTGTTDSNGEARAYYNPPTSVNDIGENVLDENWSVENSPIDPQYAGLGQITTLHTEQIAIEGGLNDIFLYQVHVDDPLQGYLDTTLDHDNYDVQVSGYYASFFQDEDIFGPTGLIPSGLDTTDDAIAWEEAHRLVWDLSRPTIFQNNQGMGRKQLVSVLDANMLNPHDFTTGAVGPMQPINVVDTGDGEHDVVFDTSTYLIPEPTGSKEILPSGTLHSYFLIAPTTINMQASVFNERLNQHILSNEISIKLTIPPYLNGLWTLDSINQNHIDEISSVLASGITASGQLVPLGWRLRSSNLTLAAALDGVTFLDLNPEYNSDPYDTDTVSGVRLMQQMRVYQVTPYP